MTSTTLLTFVCGVAVGLCAAFILMTLVSARRRRHFGVPPHPYASGWRKAEPANQLTPMQMAEQWRKDHPDTVKAWNDSKRNDEPTELDQ